MHELSAFFLTALSAIFIVVDPLGSVPAYVALTRNQSPPDLRAIAARSSLIGAGILVFFTFFGGPLFGLFGLKLDAFKAAGGLLLLMTALDMLRGRMSDCKCSAKEIAHASNRAMELAITPISMPLLAGPGAISTVMVLSLQSRGVGGTAAILAAIAITFVATYFVFRGAKSLQERLGAPGLLLLERIMGLLLAAIAVQFIAYGARGLFTGPL
ncbi:MAG TPA: MarC family protein [Bdellovibrionales bacterium]|nr:MarC family protein [Bdellovibrionales bacterium]